MAAFNFEIKNLSKSYLNYAGLKQIILENVNFEIRSGKESGSFTTILAPFGSGKTTLLKIVAGLEESDGEVNLNGKRITKPYNEIIYIPEKLSSYPWLNVRENVELPSKLVQRNDKTSSFDTNELINLVELSGYEDFYTASDTSGFRLRIAIARALSFNPRLILLDDVLKNLDGETRLELMDLLKNLSTTRNYSFLLAATNISDAILLSEKIYLMRKNPGQIIREISISKPIKIEDSEIITKYKNEIESELRSHGMLNSVLVSL
jgi:NitT/TauT family transport system ATP-binding protein